MVDVCWKSHLYASWTRTIDLKSFVSHWRWPYLRLPIQWFRNTALRGRLQANVFRSVARFLGSRKVANGMKGSSEGFVGGIAAGV